jgi:hypothetical protein
MKLEIWRFGDLEIGDLEIGEWENRQFYTINLV